VRRIRKEYCSSPAAVLRVLIVSRREPRPNRRAGMKSVEDRTRDAPPARVEQRAVGGRQETRLLSPMRPWPCSVIRRGMKCYDVGLEKGRRVAGTVPSHRTANGEGTALPCTPAKPKPLNSPGVVRRVGEDRRAVGSCWFLRDVCSVVAEHQPFTSHLPRMNLPPPLAGCVMLRLVGLVE